MSSLERSLIYNLLIKLWSQSQSNSRRIVKPFLRLHLSNRIRANPKDSQHIRPRQGLSQTFGTNFPAQNNQVQPCHNSQDRFWFEHYLSTLPITFRVRLRLLSNARFVERLYLLTLGLYSKAVLETESY